MNELITCWDCSRPGLLRLDVYPPIIEHDRGKRRCELPPRDDNRPRLNVRYIPARAMGLRVAS